MMENAALLTQAGVFKCRWRQPRSAIAHRLLRAALVTYLPVPPNRETTHKIIKFSVNHTLDRKGIPSERSQQIKCAANKASLARRQQLNTVSAASCALCSPPIAPQRGDGGIPYRSICVATQPRQQRQ